MTASKDPSPEEIRLACAEIQATWSPAERLRRLRIDMRPSYQRCDAVPVEIAADDYFGPHDRHDTDAETFFYT